VLRTYTRLVRDVNSKFMLAQGFAMWVAGLSSRRLLWSRESHFVSTSVRPDPTKQKIATLPAIAA